MRESQAASRLSELLTKEHIGLILLAQLNLRLLDYLHLVPQEINLSAFPPGYWSQSLQNIFSMQFLDL